MKTNNGKISSKKRKTNAKSRKIRVREKENLYIAGRIKKLFSGRGICFSKTNSIMCMV
jgi:hypothetical protein